MGKKTSVYLSDDLLKRWRASSLPHSEVFRRGLDAIERETPDLEATLRRVIREELSPGVSPVFAERVSYGSRPVPSDFTSEPYEDIP
jgi:hypothetical protein